MQGFSKWGQFKPDGKSGYMVCIKGGPVNKAVWERAIGEIWFASNVENGYRPMAAFLTEGKAKEFAQFNCAIEDGEVHDALSMDGGLSWQAITGEDDDPKASCRQRAYVWDSATALGPRNRMRVPAYWQVWKMSLEEEK